MNNKTWKALKKDKYPEIRFTLEPGDPTVPANKKSLIEGELTVAGKTDKIKLPVQISLQNEKLNVKGKVALKMSDFGIDPPTAMMGAMKTGDEVVIKYNIELTENPEELTSNN